MLLNIMFYAPMGRFQLELIYFCCINNERPTGQKHKLLDGTTVENKSKTTH